jgi:hypothetical protein
LAYFVVPAIACAVSQGMHIHILRSGNWDLSRTTARPQPAQRQLLRR